MEAKLKILVVDDNLAFSTNLADILELKGYEVVSVYDGFKALESVKEDGFNLVLMDIKMPVMNGVATFKKIKEITPQIPVVLMTGFSVEDLIKVALKEGAYGVLNKPIKMEKLFSIIENACPNGALIMVVDDDQELCASVKDFLSENGYRVRTVQDGKSAVQMATENNFDIILLDMKLPILNGLETYLAISDFRPDLAMIVITGYLREIGDFAQQAVEKGAYVCLEKPLDMDHLLNTIQKIIKLKSGGTIGK